MFKNIEFKVLQDSTLSEEQVIENVRAMVGGILLEKGELRINDKVDNSLYDYECVTFERVEEDFYAPQTLYLLAFDLR